MTTDNLEPISAEAFLDDFSGRVRRVGRVMLGTWDAADELVRQVRHEVLDHQSEPLPPVEMLAVGFRAIVTRLTATDAPRAGVLPTPSPNETPTERLGHALSALPLRKRLAVVLTHQENLSTLRLADAMGLTPADAERLLAAAEGHLIAIMNARGDQLDFEPKAHHD